MARKYNAKHESRGVSNYPSRLSARGLSKSPRMPFIDKFGHKHDSYEQMTKRDRKEDDG
jgi:hypothetical protein